jgi:hypothetical protein
MHVCALEVPYEDALEVYPRVDAVCGEMLEPCSGAFHKVEWQVLDDEEIVVPPPAQQTRRKSSNHTVGLVSLENLTMFGGAWKRAGNGV